MGGMARHEPYGSAADIPSIADMPQKIEGGKLLTRFIARDQRAKLVELEQQVREHIAVIDHFSAGLEPRNWMRGVRLRRGRLPGSGVSHVG
jgi:hypothetical protein